MSDLGNNRLYQATPNQGAMPPSDHNSVLSAQQIPQFQNTTEWVDYFSMMMGSDERMSGEPEVNLGTSMTRARLQNDLMMYHFKVHPCPINRHHIWEDCPWTHKGENWRRRVPQTYSAKPCAYFKTQRKCMNEDSCTFAHGMLETQLHPDYYKTRMCRNLGNCPNRICFFAHSAEELRERDSVSNRN